MTLLPSSTDALRDHIRTVPGFERAELAGVPQSLAGGFWATMFLVPLLGAPAPVVVLRLVPDAVLARKEEVFQEQAAGQGFPAPAVYVSGGADSGLGQPFVVMAYATGAPPLAGLDGVAALRRLPYLVRALPDLLGRVMARLHHLDPAPFRDALDARTMAIDTDGLVDALRQWSTGLGREDLARAAKRLAQLRPPGRSPVVCHGDLHPFNVLVDGDTWTLVDWTAAILADPEYDVAYTTMLLEHPPLTGPGLLAPVIRAGGKCVARRFQASYESSGGRRPEPARLRWYAALHSLRILLEVEGWRHDGNLDQHAGHPWFSIGATAAQTLAARTGEAVDWIM